MQQRTLATVRHDVFKPAYPLVSNPLPLQRTLSLAGHMRVHSFWFISFMPVELRSDWHKSNCFA